MITENNNNKVMSEQGSKPICWKEYVMVRTLYMILVMILLFEIRNLIKNEILIFYFTLSIISN